MPRPVYHSLAPSHSNYPSFFNSVCLRLVLSFAFCSTVTMIIRYAYFGDKTMMMWPNSDHLFKVNPFFADHILAKSDARREVKLFGFSRKPDRSLETNSSFSRSIYLDQYSNRGFCLWLNRGSSLLVSWTVYPETPVLIRVMKLGESGFKTLQPHPTGVGILEKQIAKYRVNEDGIYTVDFANVAPVVVNVAIRINHTAKMYATDDASTNCSSSNGVCKLKLLLPDTNYVLILTTSQNDDNAVWCINISYAGRVIAYVFILGFFVVLANLLLKLLHDLYIRGTSHDEVGEPQSESATERDSLVAKKEVPRWYGSIEHKNVEPLQMCSSSSSSSNTDTEIYDGKICSICYDEERNCFFIPCGHFATCCTCAQRIANGNQSKVCPICRRLVHKIKRLF